MTDGKQGDASTEVSELSELRARVAQLERENRRLRERCEEAELQVVQLERGVKNVENTLSFRLGNALIQSTKSVDGLKSLPRVLGELRSDRRRGKGDENPRNLLGSALRASAAAAHQKVRLKKKKAKKG